MADMGSRQSSLMASSGYVMRDSVVSIVLSILIVALRPIQFGFTGRCSSPTQDDIIADLSLSLSEGVQDVLDQVTSSHGSSKDLKFPSSRDGSQTFEIYITS
ncbi:hypothetical protein Cni_G26405 [Canna indica]|uniref:Uncharacterized protein n=1 Tax=Canna indica TaxID=4628 RepID=A0AAQ3L623_9LILI|nr:hypothetical protein Cni_G26405 [Canna indica]